MHTKGKHRIKERIHFHRHVIMEDKYGLPENHVIVDKDGFQEVLKIISLGVDAEYICKCVNNHEKLMRALKEAKSDLETLYHFAISHGIHEAEYPTHKRIHDLLVEVE